MRVRAAVCRQDDVARRGVMRHDTDTCNMCIYIYIYIYVHTYIHIHVYTHMYDHTCIAHNIRAVSIELSHAIA